MLLLHYLPKQVFSAQLPIPILTLVVRRRGEGQVLPPDDLQRHAHDAGGVAAQLHGARPRIRHPPHQHARPEGRILRGAPPRAHQGPRLQPGAPGSAAQRGPGQVCYKFIINHKKNNRWPKKKGRTPPNQHFSHKE